jgi:hypothetical protein
MGGEKKSIPRILLGKFLFSRSPIPTPRKNFVVKRKLFFLSRFLLLRVLCTCPLEKNIGAQDKERAKGTEEREDQG